MIYSVFVYKEHYLVKIGLALGAGGARGLAHIKILEAFDELNIKPSIISGSSIGAIIGAAYASGMTAKEIKLKVDALINTRESKAWEFYKNSDIKLLFNFIDFNMNGGGIIKGDKFKKFMENEIKVDTFEDLQIPLKIVATHYWKKSQRIFTNGNLIPAITASYSLPGLFSPTVINNELYFDGGMVNPVPFDIINENCDYVIAVDVSANKFPKSKKIPSFYENIFSAFQIMQNSILSEKLSNSKPDLLIKIKVKNVRMLDFTKTAEIFEQAEEAKKELKIKLKKMMKE